MTSSSHLDRKASPTADAVLLVESDPAQRETLGRVLRSEGHQVLEAGSAEAGLDLLRAGQLTCASAHVSLVVVGEGPLGRTGAQLLRGMSRAGLPKTPALLLTSSESVADTAGVTLGLRKPFRVEDLLALVDDFQQKRRSD